MTGGFALARCAVRTAPWVNSLPGGSNSETLQPPGDMTPPRAVPYWANGSSRWPSERPEQRREDQSARLRCSWRVRNLWRQQPCWRSDSGNTQPPAGKCAVDPPTLDEWLKTKRGPEQRRQDQSADTLVRGASATPAAAAAHRPGNRELSRPVAVSPTGSWTNGSGNQAKDLNDGKIDQQITLFVARPRPPAGSSRPPAG